MGLDATIRIYGLSKPQLMRLTREISARWPRMTEHFHWVPVIEGADEIDWCNPEGGIAPITLLEDHDGIPAIDLCTPWRFYSADYPRGPWPILHALIRLCQEACPSQRLEYGSETEVFHELSPGFLDATWAHWLHCDNSTFSILQAQTSAHLDDASILFREYAASLPFSLCFQGFEQELATLPGRYAPPSGRLFIAYDRGTSPAGCIALRDISAQTQPNTCEMKRLYVRPDHRKSGLGRNLCKQLISEARAIGYARMKLDTSADMHAAIALYTSLGFTPCERYNDDPLDDTLWFELRL